MADQNSTAMTISGACQEPDFVTDEDLKLREKVAALERALVSISRVYGSEYRPASEALLNILDPVTMTEEEQQACLRLIVFCRRKMSERLELPEVVTNG